VSGSDYYGKVSDLQCRLTGLIKSLTEAQKIISPCPKGTGDYPGLIDKTPKAIQRVLLNNAWIVLQPLESSGEFGSEIDELLVLLEEVGNCPIEPETEFQGYKIGE